MSNDQFRQAEDRYFLLRGQLETGVITRQQFDAALKDMMVQDAQGRYWMIGADSGKWYVHDGQAWVEAEPTSPPVPSPERRGGEGERGRGASPTYPAQSIGGKRNNNLLIAVGVAVAVLLVGATILFWLVTQGPLKIAQATPTIAPLPTLVSTVAPPTNVVIVITATPPPVATLPPAPPTTALTATPTATVTPTPPPTAPPTVAPTTLPPTQTHTPTRTLTPPPTATPKLPAGMYVTNLRLEPAPPKRQQEVGFYATFLNTAEGEQNLRWMVYIYRQDNLKNSLGETSRLATTFPVGASEQKALGNWKTGIGGCENYLARVAELDQNNQPTFFKKTDGTIYELPFAVCP